MKYPEHEKLKAREHESHVLSGFLDMLDERGLVLGLWHQHDKAACYAPSGERTCHIRTDHLCEFGVPTKAELIGLYLDVDPKKLSAEKDAMYQELVAANTQRTPSLRGSESSSPTD